MPRFIEYSVPGIHREGRLAFHKHQQPIPDQNAQVIIPVLHHQAGKRDKGDVLRFDILKNVCNLLPNSAFTGSNGANSFQQLTEIICTKYSIPLFQSFIVQCESFLNELSEYSCSPDAELGCSSRINTISN